MRLGRGAAALILMLTGCTSSERVQVDEEARAGDVVFSDVSAAGCEQDDLVVGDDSVPGPYCLFSLMVRNDSSEPLELSSQDQEIEINGRTFPAANHRLEDFEDYFGRDAFTGVVVAPGNSFPAMLLFADLESTSVFPYELHLVASDGEEVIVELPRCAVTVGDECDDED